MVSKSGATIVHIEHFVQLLSQFYLLNISSTSIYAPISTSVYTITGVLEM